MESLTDVMRQAALATAVNRHRTPKRDAHNAYKPDVLAYRFSQGLSLSDHPSEFSYEHWHGDASDEEKEIGPR